MGALERKLQIVVRAGFGCTGKEITNIQVGLGLGALERKLQIVVRAGFGCTGKEITNRS